MRTGVMGDPHFYSGRSARKLEKLLRDWVNVPLAPKAPWPTSEQLNRQGRAPASKSRGAHKAQSGSASRVAVILLTGTSLLIQQQVKSVDGREGITLLNLLELACRGNLEQRGQGVLSRCRESKARKAPKGSSAKRSPLTVSRYGEATPQVMIGEGTTNSGLQNREVLTTHSNTWRKDQILGSIRRGGIPRAGKPESSNSQRGLVFLL